MTDRESDLVEKVVIWVRRLRLIPIILIVLAFFGLIIFSAWKRECTLPQVIVHFLETGQPFAQSC